MRFRKEWHFLIGVVIGLVAYLLFVKNVPSETDMGKMLGFAIFLIYLWLTEPVSMQASALLPIIFLPAMGLLSLKEAATPYAHPVIFLFLGGFVMAKGLEKWQIHRRIALFMLAKFGNNPDKIIGAMMLATALISMCISNTATTIMMLPIGLSINQIIEKEFPKSESFPIAMLIAIAYAANVGGEGTIIGSPPNVILVGILQDQMGITIDFLDWMMVGIPLVFLMLLPAYFLITKIFYKTAKGKTIAIQKHFGEELKKMGPLNNGEKRTIFILCLSMFLWIFKNNINDALQMNIWSDTGIAIFGSFLMIALPTGSEERILTWKEAQQIAWGILIFFGGALSLANGLSKTGTIQYITNNLLDFPAGFPSFWVIGICIATMLFLTEFMGGTALSSIFVPILIGLSTALNIPVLELCFTVVFASNCSFMLPMATPPNAIVFSTGQLQSKHMAFPGFIMNLIGILIIWLIGHQLIKLVF